MRISVHIRNYKKYFARPNEKMRDLSVVIIKKCVLFAIISWFTCERAVQFIANPFTFLANGLVAS